ncbi:MAG: TetR/AcrR family transcriptional regulator [Lachnospiraceae bacterium]|nr:TetR/AcrR family transcriptional regulator [Lachnospiraceae bacterium]
MGDKSVQKRKYIIERARNVFYRNGYRTVTMKDIVEACDISRGGLYLYFSNTKELFEAVLEEECADVGAVMVKAQAAHATPGEMMLNYLDEQKKVILRKKDNITAAIYEYLFENKPVRSDNPVKKLFQKNVTALEKLIADGVEQEWMVCEDTAEAARNIAYTIEGLKVSAQTIGVTAEAVDREIEYIMGTLGMVIK